MAALAGVPLSTRDLYEAGTQDKDYLMLCAQVVEAAAQAKAQAYRRG